MTTTDDHKARPRIEGDREDEILEAALTVLAEVGYDRLTMDAVAAAAKASKATLYRRWTSKAHLVVDAAVRAKGCPLPDDVNTGSLRGDLLTMSTCEGGLTDNVPMSVLSGIVTAMQHDPALRQTFQTAFLGPRVAMMQVVFERARERGELATDVDIAQIWDVLPAVFIHRACVLGEPPSADLVTRIVDYVVLPAAGVTAAGASS